MIMNYIFSIILLLFLTLNLYFICFFIIDLVKYNYKKMK